MSRDHLSSLPSSGPPWDIVLSNLDLQSLKNLRLCSKQLASACTHHRFLSFLSHQSTDLGVQSLASLATLTAHALVRGVKHLTINATIYNKRVLDSILKSERREMAVWNPETYTQSTRPISDEEYVLLEAESAWMEERLKEQEDDTISEDALANSLAGILRNLSGDEDDDERAIESIKLEAPIISRRQKSDVRPWDATAFPDWRAAWRHAARAYRVTMLALARSGVAVRKLIIYQETKRCGITPGDILATLPALQMNQTNSGPVGGGGGGRRSGGLNLKGIREFAICIGLGLEDLEEQQLNLTAGRAASELAKTINNNMTSLSSLDLKIYRSKSSELEPERWVTIFQELVTGIHLPSLCHVRLRGVKASRQTLMEFINKHHFTIQHLELEQFILMDEDINSTSNNEHSGGSPGIGWGDIIRDLIKTLPALDKLWLSNLHGVAGNGLMNLYPEGARLDLWHEDEDEDEERENSEQPTREEEKKPTWKTWGFSRMRGRHIHTIHLEGKDQLREDIQFRPPPGGRQMGSAEFSNWLRGVQDEYGPYDRPT